MAVTGIGKIAGITSSILFVGFLCLGIALFVIAATITLSLIAIYTPNHSEKGYGEQYQIRAFIIKVLYQNITSSFENGTVAYSASMSTLCGSMYRKQQIKNFAGCVAKNFYAFGSDNNSQISKRRRRAVAIAGLYEIGEVSLYYSTSCLSKADRYKYGNGNKLSSCVKNRLAACNSLMNSSSSFIPWKPLPESFGQLILDAHRYAYQPITVQNVYVIPIFTASSLANNLGLSNTTKQYLQLGCQYIKPLRQSDIATALIGQSTDTTTQPMPSNAPVS